MWLTEFQIALVEKNTQKIVLLLDEIPVFEHNSEIDSALYLFAEAASLLNSLKDETAQSMMQIKKNIDFLKSTDHAMPSRLDITL